MVNSAFHADPSSQRMRNCSSEYEDDRAVMILDTITTTNVLELFLSSNRALYLSANRRVLAMSLSLVTRFLREDDDSLLRVLLNYCLFICNRDLPTLETATNSNCAPYPSASSNPIPVQALSQIISSHWPKFRTNKMAIALS